MRRGFHGIKFEMGACVVTSLDEDEFPTAQPDALGDEPRVGSYELHHNYGFYSKCLDPQTGPNGQLVEGQACNLLIGVQDDETHAWLASDPRILPKLPILKQGESLQYGSAGNFCRMHADGKISIFTTTDGTPEGKSVYHQTKPDGFLWVSPWGKMVLDATGFHVLTAGGAEFHLGSIAGLPAPLSALSSYACISAHIIQAEASVASEGTTVGLPEPVAKATSLLTELTALQSAVAALQTAVTAVGASLSGIANGGAAAAAVSATATTASSAAVSAAATALAAATQLIPSKSKQVT